MRIFLTTQPGSCRLWGVSAVCTPQPGLAEEQSVSACERLVVIGKLLANSSDKLLAALPAQVRTSSDLMKATGVNKDIASRFLSALSKRDPMAVAYYMPGVESLRRLSHGARSAVSNKKAVEEFDKAVSAFEGFLQDELGGRHALDAMASAWLPEAREKFEFTSRQMAFRSAANLRGLECQVITNTAIVHPGADTDRYDAVQVAGMLGLQRLRPSVPLMLTMFDHRDDTSGLQAQTLDVRPIRGDSDAAEFLPQFGRGKPPRIGVVRKGTASIYQLVDEGLGAEAAGDLFFGQATPGLMRRWGRHAGDIAAVMEAVEIPAQRLVMDVLLHPDVWPGIEPELMHYNTGVRGAALPYDRSRDMDRVDLLDTVRYVGTGVDYCRMGEAPKYVELLRWACQNRGWDPSCFRVYRCDSRYPVVGVQYTMAFKLQERGAAG